MKIDKLNRCVKSISSIFHDFNGSPPLLLFLFLAIVQLREQNYEYHKQLTANKMRNECGNVHTALNFLSKTLYFVHDNRNGSCYLQFSQVSIKRNATLDKDFLDLISNISSSRGSG